MRWRKQSSVFFQGESERVIRALKPAEMKRFVVQNGVVYDEGRLSPEFQFKTKDLDQVRYLDKQQIVGRIPVVLPYSPVLYAYPMYVHTKMTIQPEILELLLHLPVSACLTIRRDIRGVEEFYSLVSGEEVRVKRGFIDLTSLAILAGYKFQSRNMTAIGVQVLGTLLNKSISTGDDYWQQSLESLRCYALGDIMFGFVSYNVLSGLLLRDVFSDPDVLCRFLKCNQKIAVDWFLDFVLMSLEGVEFHQRVEDGAETREEMILSLRYRNERELADFSPPMVRLWTRILGNWLGPTSGGCRYLLKAREWFLHGSPG